MNVHIFSDSVEDFIHSLQDETVAKVLRTIELLEAFGHKIGSPHSRKVAKEIFELRIRGKQEVRILYAFRKGECILLHGFIKKTQKLPKRELNLARDRLHGFDTA